jgi:hypothetical protein
MIGRGRGRGRGRGFVVGLVCVLVLGVFGGGVVGSAFGVGVPGPGWEVFGFFAPSDLAPGGSGKLVLFVYDVGAGGSVGSVTLTDRLPAGLVLPGGSVVTNGASCVGSTEVVCEFGGAPPAGEPATLEIPVSVAEGVTGTAEDEVEVMGGGALGVARAEVPAVFSALPAGLGFSNVDGWVTNADGTADVQAGSHPYALTVAFAFDNEVVGSEHQVVPAGGEARTIDVKLPPGLVGNPTAVPQCSRQLFDDGELALENGEGCPASSNIGIALVGAKGVGRAGFSVFNLVPPPGVAALFGFDITGGIPVLLEARVRSGGDYGITEHVQNAPQREPIYSSVTIWGSPAEESHDALRRGADCERGCAANAPVVPFLTLPTSCGAPQEFVAEELNTWQNEAPTSAARAFSTHAIDGSPAGFTGCESLAHFEPSMAIAPDTTWGDTPAGLTADLRVPQNANGEGSLATPGLKDTTVTLPEGLAINPGQATGLVACLPGMGPGHDDLPSAGQDGEGEAWDGPAECPAASRIGTDAITTRRT